MISLSPFTDMFLIRHYEIFLECQLCCFELGREGQNVQRRKGNGMWEGLGRGHGVCGLSQPPAGSQNILIHFRVLKGKCQGKCSGRLGDCGPQGGYNRRSRVRFPPSKAHVA